MSFTCHLIGAPVQSGTNQAGCLMGPDALRTAGIAATLEELGHSVGDLGNLSIEPVERRRHSNPAIHHLGETADWAKAIGDAAHEILGAGGFPIFLGGDHSLSIGSMLGVCQAARDAGREQFVLWLDAHPDFHTLDTTRSGNLHGTPIAYLTGESGFDGYCPELPTMIAPENVCMMGIRSVDPAERERLSASPIQVFDMRALDENGIAGPLRTFLDKVERADGQLHISLDVDFLEPGIAPAVGTTVPGGATFREAHLIMEMVCDSGLATSLDLVELNPFLDERGRTARLMVDLCASLLGRKVLDRPTYSH